MNKCVRRFGNGLTFEQLAQIEEMAHRSRTDEAQVILLLAAALRESMQIVMNDLALDNEAASVNRDLPRSRLNGNSAESSVGKSTGSS
jgi:hypothetical protein